MACISNSSTFPTVFSTISIASIFASITIIFAILSFVFVVRIFHIGIQIENAKNLIPALILLASVMYALKSVAHIFQLISTAVHWIQFVYYAIATVKIFSETNTLSSASLGPGQTTILLYSYDIHIHLANCRLIAPILSTLFFTAISLDFYALDIVHRCRLCFVENSIKYTNDGQSSTLYAIENSSVNNNNNMTFILNNNDETISHVIASNPHSIGVYG